MKKTEATVDYCGCDCPNCDYSQYNTIFEVECPYKKCEHFFSESLFNGDAKSQVVDCPECGKEFEVSLSYNHM